MPEDNSSNPDSGNFLIYLDKIRLKMIVSLFCVVNLNDG